MVGLSAARSASLLLLDWVGDIDEHLELPVEQDCNELPFELAIIATCAVMHAVCHLVMVGFEGELGLLGLWCKTAQALSLEVNALVDPVLSMRGTAVRVGDEGKGDKGLMLYTRQVSAMNKTTAPAWGGTA
jgi:hypothetical protein